MELAYKVVRANSCHSNLFTSAILKSGHLFTIYTIGKWTVKRKYGPLVFNKLCDAISFARNYKSLLCYDLRIFKCEAENLRPAPELLSVDNVRTLNFETVRRTMDRNVKLGLASSAPQGSFIASRIRLLYEVNSW
jgi:hypothetical protein